MRQQSEHRENNYIIYILSGELTGAGYDGCSGAGQSGLCQTAPREWSQHSPLPHHSQAGRVIQHGESSTMLSDTSKREKKKN